MNRLIILLLTIALPAVAAGPADFARGRLLEGESDFVHRITVPADVYRWVTRSDLGDLRVFDDGEEEVPYAIRRPQSRDEYSAWYHAPVFPLPEAQSQGSADARINVEVDDGGAIVAVSGMRTGSEPAAAFVVDASAFNATPTEMQIDWAGKATGEFVGKIRIESSDDLDGWQTVVGATTLARLSTGGHHVKVDLVVLPRAPGRYFRLTQVEGNDRLDISRVELRNRAAQLPDREWKRLTAKTVDEGFEFASEGLFPVDRIDVEVGDGSYLLRARLLSRPTEEGQWRSRGEHLFYRTSVDGLEVGSDPVPLRSRDQYWRLELENDVDQPPVLRIGWLPDELIYLNQSSRPHLMAYGQAGVESRQWPVKQLLAKLNGEEPRSLTDVAVARVGEPMALGGPDRRVPAPEPIDWQTVVLWVVLVLGVLIVGGFAYRLLKA